MKTLLFQFIDWMENSNPTKLSDYTWEMLDAIRENLYRYGGE